MLKEGDRIPDFRVMDQDGNTVTQKDFEGDTKGFRREEDSALFLSERQYSGMYGRGL